MGPAQQLPTGVVTFLLTDIEGSTRLWERDPDAMRQALERHDSIVAAGVRRMNGHIVKSKGEGDSVFAVFPHARNALMAALVIQAALNREPWPTATPIRVRMAMHTGRIDPRDGDYFGPTVNRCARLRALAKGGEVLVSGATADLVRGGLPSGASLIDLGTHMLKDLSTPERIWRLAHPQMAAPTQVDAPSAAAPKPAPRRAYKLTDHLNHTPDGRAWGPGVTYLAAGEAAGSDETDWIHCYGSPVLAGLLNPVYEGFRLPRLWEATVDAEADLSSAVIRCKRVTTLRQATLPTLTGLHHARFAVLCAREVFTAGRLADAFGSWAAEWLAGQDSSGMHARELAEALEAEANHAGGLTRPGEMLAANAAWAAAHATRASWLTGRAREQEYAEAVALARDALHTALRVGQLDLQQLADEAVQPPRPAAGARFPSAAARVA